MKKNQIWALIFLDLFLISLSGIIFYSEATVEYAQIWITSAIDPNIRLSPQKPLKFNLLFDQEGENFEGSEVYHEINIDPNKRYQLIHGFGAAMTDSSAWLLHEILNSSKYHEVMQALFDPFDGIGLSYLRIPLGASDCAQEFYTYDDTAPDLTDFSVTHDEDYLFPVLKDAKALNPSLKLIGSPWSAPGWMKIGNNLTDSNTKGMIGGELNPKMYGIYAEYLVNILSAFQERNLTLDALTLQNEQFYTPLDYPGMYMNVSSTQDFVQILGTAIKTANLTTKLLILDHNWVYSNQALEILSNSDAASFIDGIAWHGYEDAVPERQSDVHQRFPSKLQYFTEVSGLQAYQSFPHNLAWTFHNIFAGSLRNWASAVLLWNLALDQNGGPHLTDYTGLRGVITIPQINNQLTGEIKFDGEYYMLGHFSKFVHSGAVRIESTNIGNTLETVAFRNLDQSLIIVLCNPTDQIQSSTIKIGALCAKYTFPARSIATIILNSKN